MTTPPARPPAGEAARAAAPVPTLIWIDAREAIVVRWRRAAATLERIESEVPDHHRSTGHVRHDPAVRHGGGGVPQSAGEPHRQEHIARFVDDVARRLWRDERLVVIGPGTMREVLARHVREADSRRARQRPIDCLPSARLSDRQLVARLRRIAGVVPHRRTVGAWRWTEAFTGRRAGTGARPRRVVEKPLRQPDRNGT